jgi:cellulose synthase/poly-beta-1,6-N-acetylglucosamine synthase-like glycosyltransferase
VAYRKAVFEEIGFFDIGLLRAEDIDLAWRMQLETDYKFYATPEAIIYHRHPTTFREAIKQRYKGGAGTLFILDKYLGLDRQVRREVIMETSLDLILNSSLALGSLLFRCLKLITRRYSDPLYLDEALLNLFGGISQNCGRIQACLNWEQTKKYAYLD